MKMMWKIHKQDELNCNQRITSDAMLPKLWKDLTVTEAWKVCVYFLRFLHILLPPITINYSIQHSFDILVFKNASLKKLA